MSVGRELLRRFVSVPVLIALAAEVGLLLIDALSAMTPILTTSYLVPVLVVAIFETGERTAVVAVAAAVLAVLSGVWDDYLFTGEHWYRLSVVTGAAVLGTAGAAFRSRAVAARDRMETLARIGEIADGTGDLEEALRRLAAVLVPGTADLAELTVLDSEGPRRLTSRLRSGDETEQERLQSRPPVSMEVADAAARGGALLLNTLELRGERPAGLPENEAETLRQAGISAAIYVPVRAADHTLAVLTMAVGPSGRRYGREDVRFARTVAGRAALAIQNARLLAELGEARTRMETIVGTLPDAVTIRDPSGRLVYANHAALRMMDMPTTEDIGERDPVALFNDYYVSDEHGNTLSLDALPSVRLLAGEDPEPLVMRIVNPSTGEEAWRVLKSTALRDGHGHMEAAVTIIEDITPTKQAERRSEFLARASQLLGSSLDYEETLRNVAWLAVPDIADWCAVDLIDENGRRQQVVAAHRDPAKLELAERLRSYEPDEPDPDEGLGLVLRTGEPQLYRDIPAALVEQAAIDAEHLELLRAVQLRSAIVVPLRGANRILGAMTLVNAESGRSFAEEHVAFAEQLAARAGVAVENAHLYSERTRIATTLQHSLLPEALPTIEGWELASLYRPASADGAVEVGGDFYDAFPVGESWVVLIGDVTGKGVEAAAMTALVRHGARFTAEYLPEPAQILARLDRYLRQQPMLSLCTALCLRIDGDRVTFASAGHPLPLVVTDDGVRTVGSGGPVLGAFADSDWPAQALTLGPQEVLLLYTDGVTDTVGDGDRFGEQRLSRVMAECGPLAPIELLGCLDAALSRFQVGSQADDTAALALRLAGQPHVAELSGLRRRADS